METKREMRDFICESVVDTDVGSIATVFLFVCGYVSQRECLF